MKEYDKNNLVMDFIIDKRIVYILEKFDGKFIIDTDCFGYNILLELDLKDYKKIFETETENEKDIKIILDFLLENKKIDKKEYNEILNFEFDKEK